MAVFRNRSSGRWRFERHILFVQLPLCEERGPVAEKFRVPVTPRIRLRGINPEKPHRHVRPVTETNLYRIAVIHTQHPPLEGYLAGKKRPAEKYQYKKNTYTQCRKIRTSRSFLQNILLSKLKTNTAPPVLLFHHRNHCEAMIFFIFTEAAQTTKGV